MVHLPWLLSFHGLALDRLLERPPRAPHHPSASYDAAPRKDARASREPGGGGRTPPVCAPQVASSPPYGPASDGVVARFEN